MSCITDTTPPVAPIDPAPPAPIDPPAEPPVVAPTPITPTVCACPPGPNFSDGPIGRLYETILDRAPDPGGLSWWTAAYQGGMSLDAIASGLMDSTEATAVFAVAPISKAIVQCYEYGLHRAPDAAGASYWSNALLTGQANVASMAASISQSAEAVALWHSPA